MVDEVLINSAKMKASGRQEMAIADSRSSSWLAHHILKMMKIF